MRDRLSVPKFAWVLLGLMVISAALLALNKREVETFPSASSYGPSGSNALYRLLIAQGYKVVIDHAPRPRLKPEDTVINFALPQDDLFRNEDITTFEEAMSGHRRNGGRVLEVHLPSDFEQATRFGSEPVASQWIDGETLQVNTGNEESEILYRSTGGVYVSTVGHNSSYFAIEKVGPGFKGVVRDGISFTNRFLDRNDNAAAAVKTIAALAHPKGRIVFGEASFGNAIAPGLLETIGGWAQAAWWQIVFLFIVVCYTLGKRFGLPEEDRYEQRGSRELVDALANVYRRAGATDAALSAYAVQVDRELRSLLKMPMDATRADRNRQLPQDLVKLLVDVEAAATMRIGGDQALTLARNLDAKLNEFTGSRPREKMRKRKYS